MMKHFPTALMLAAWLLFAASSSRQFANALTNEQVDEAEDILVKMEDEVKALRDKLEEVSSSLGNRSIAGSYRYRSWQL